MATTKTMDYKAIKGDTLSKIARTYGTTVQDILKANPQIKNANLIFEGSTYKIPISDSTSSLYENVDGNWVKKSTEVKADDLKNKQVALLGDNSLIDFSDDGSPTLYIFNRNSRTYTPIESVAAAANYFNKSIKEIENVVNIVPSAIRDLPETQGTLLDYSFRIKADGTQTNPPEDTSATTDNNLKSIYGKTQYEPAVEETTGNIIGTLFTTANLKGDISDSTFQSTLMNPTQLAKYVNAVLYGGYTIGDIYRDVKAKDLATKGYTQYNNFKAFDENVPASTWLASNEGTTATNDQNLVPPSNLNIDESLFTLPIFQIPGNAFTTLVEPIDFTSPEFQAEAENIQAAYYDIMMQKAEATTEQQKTIADSNWKLFKENLAKKYGIQLSDNARTAWGQLQSTFSGTAQRGLENSGIMNEMVDRQLADTRLSNQRLREAKLDEEEEKQRNQLLQYGSPEEINAFVASNPEKAKEWGLTPSEETAKFFSLDNLRQLYPDKSDSDLLLYRNLVLNDQGNYQSGIYQKMYADKFDLAKGKKEYQEQTLYNQKMAEEQKAYAPWTTSNPLSSYVTPGSKVEDVIPKTQTPIEQQQPVIQTSKVSETPKYTEAINQAQNIAESPKVNPQPSYNDYTVVRGDTLSGLAKRYNTTISDIMKINPQITNPNLIYAGKTYKIPKIT